GVSRGRARLFAIQKRRGQRRGRGSRKGRKGARQPSKDLWIAKIRSQRRYLRGLRENNLITPTSYRQLYAKAKGNLYRNVAHLRNTVYESGIVKKSKGKRR
ncbi:MAG: 50S ribosomal protein L19e, partial [Candidatus Hodarchaeales archaeon]